MRKNPPQPAPPRAPSLYYWIIDPEARVLEALELRDGTWVEVAAVDEESTARIPPFDVSDLEVGRLFLPREADELPTDETPV